MESKGKWVELDKQKYVTKWGWDDGSKFLNPDRPYYTVVAYVKWDGCTNLYQFANGSEDESDEITDYIHICKVKDFGEMLLALVSHVPEL